MGNDFVEAAPRIELGNKGFADLCLTAWLCRHIKLVERETRFELATPALARRCSTAELFPHVHGASGQNRTVDTRIFSPLLYRLSYRTIMAVQTGIEPAISSVTGKRIKPLYHWTVVAEIGFEPMTFGL